MSYFRIFVYLKLKIFFLAIVKRNKTYTEIKIKKIINNYTGKNFTFLTGQLRVGFYLILNYLKKNYPKKNEIILNSYNLPAMVNVCKNLNLKLIFPNLNKNIFISESDLKKKINKKTLAIVFTNIFNNTSDITKIKKICSKKKIPLIEDNAIYFGNYTKKNGKKRYAGSYGDYSLHSFNIMKNICGMYGGCISTNDKNFYNFCQSKSNELVSFPKIKYLKQCIVFFILKIFSINFFYKLFFFKILSWAHRKNNKTFLSLIYPSLKFKKGKHHLNFKTKISEFSKKIILSQLNDKRQIIQNHKLRKRNNRLYDRFLNKIKNQDFNLINIIDSNFQNFNEYPIILKNKKITKLLVNYLFKNSIEIKKIQYADCEIIFNNKINSFNNYQDKIICLPNHPNIQKKYIRYIVSKIKNFFSQKNYEIPS